MLTRGDFHIHSTASDGGLSPTEIILSARNIGIDTLAITDHNTVNGVSEAASAGRLYGVSVIPAVELSTKFKNESIHILGFFRDNNYYNPYFTEALGYIRNHRVKLARNILRNFMYTDYYTDSLSTFEGINFLRAFGAAVVLAHPVRISKKNLSSVLALPFDGIEAKYCHNSYSDTFFFVNTALMHFSFYTGGSDFHTYNKRHQSHCFIGEPYLNYNEIQIFLNNSGAVLLS
jgi:predicted metal-dependent phosphoesterase TrpH